MDLDLQSKISELTIRNQERQMNSETLNLAVDIMVDYYQNSHHKEWKVSSIQDLQLMSLCAELCDYYNAFDNFLGTDRAKKSVSHGELAKWINDNSKATYERFSNLANEFERSGKIEHDSIIEYFSEFYLNRKINEKLLIEQLRFASIHIIEIYRKGDLDDCKKGLLILLKIAKTAFPQTSNPFVFELLGFLNFWIGKSHRQTNFENARKYLRVAKENFTFASLTAQNNKKFSDFAKYQIQRIYFVSLSEARLRLIERNIPQALVLVEPLVDVIPESDSFGKAYALYVRGVCKRVLQGRLAEDAITDLIASLKVFQGNNENPPFPRHVIRVVRELVISYILMGKISEAKEIINNLEMLIDGTIKASKINRFAKLKNSPWKVLRDGLLSRISRKESKICWHEAKLNYSNGEMNKYLSKMSESEKHASRAIELADRAVSNSDFKIPSVDCDLLVIKGEAYFYKGLFFDLVDTRRKKRRPHQNTQQKSAIEIAYESFEKAISLNKKSIEGNNSGKSDESTHENLELTAICLIYMSHIQFMKNNFDEGVRLISKYLSIEQEVHSKWVKELYDNVINTFILLSMSQIETDFNRNPRRDKMSFYEDHLLRALTHKFKSDAAMAKYFNRKRSSISRSLKPKTKQ